MSSAWQGDKTHQGASGLFGLKNQAGGVVGAGTLIFGTLSGGAAAALTKGNFWQGAVTGLIVSGLNHTLHDAFDGGGDPPKKRKEDFKFGKLKPLGEFSLSTAEFTYKLKATSILDARKGLSINSKVGTFKSFSAQYRAQYKPFSKIGGTLGKVNNLITAYNTYNDVSDYNNGNLSGARLSYRLGGTGASILTATYVGGQYGGGWGAVAGFLVSSTFSVGEMIYDGWNNTVMPAINQATYQINNNHGWTNFHP